MRKYIYINGDLSKLQGCRLVADHGRGHGAELQVGCTVPFSPEHYPDRVCLVTPVGSAFQVVPIADDGTLVEAITAAASKAGLAVYASAKELAAALPAVADALYPRREKLDAQGKPTGQSEKVPGGVLQVACCLCGDDPVKAADPGKVEAEPKPLDAGLEGEAIK